LLEEAIKLLNGRRAKDQPLKPSLEGNGVYKKEKSLVPHL
jgi:hypothetical protein